MTDNGLTPHIVIDATRPGVTIPEGAANDGKVVLNVSYAATRALQMGNDTIELETRFGGVSRAVSVPVTAVLGIYARETGQGMLFNDDNTPPPASPDDPPPDGARRPTLKVVK
jgi:stringent starvation protein B